ncbi:DUF6177 family protein [Microbacterium sp. VKM Ac-2923]|uniref:DUF6177 family protein n=1 Tax=Microbacterium sp. VKM Ac-2923 TaxID=2929476 RepID=UPI001FB3792B|nr:DUF6177 family protein [Microbacterium sp. VKM Ac-2923]MCJ1708344.1 DUF6177 family protein [Microbacterium sp. VKM Ac-2923]
MTTVDHPLLDAAGPGWAGTETRAPIIALTTAMSDWLHTTATQGLRPLVVSGEHSRMTQPLAQVLSAVQGHWAVRTRDDGFYDARTGVRLDAPADALTVGAPTPETVHPFFLRAQVASTLQVVATVSTRHRVTRPLRLGGVAEAAVALFTDAEPAAWGGVEPLLAPWDRDDLTERSRRRIPLDSHWIAVGGGERAVIATIHAARTSEGLEETTRVWAAVPGVGREAGTAATAEARELLARAATVGLPLIGVAFAAIGAPDLARRATAAPHPEPLALLIGPPGVRALGIDAKRWIEEAGGTIVGSPRLPGVLLPLGSVDGGGWTRLNDVLATLDPARLADLLAVAPHVRAQLDSPGGVR